MFFKKSTIWFALVLSPEYGFMEIVHRRIDTVRSEVLFM